MVAQVHPCWKISEMALLNLNFPFETEIPFDTKLMNLNEVSYICKTSSIIEGMYLTKL